MLTNKNYPHKMDMTQVIRIQKNIKNRIKSISRRVEINQKHYLSLDELKLKGENIISALRTNEEIHCITINSYAAIRKLHYLYDNINIYNIENMMFLLNNDKWMNMSIRDIKVFFNMTNTISLEKVA